MYRTLTAAVALTAALGVAGLAHAQSSVGPSTSPNTMAPSTPSTNMNPPTTSMGSMGSTRRRQYALSTHGPAEYPAGQFPPQRARWTADEPGMKPGRPMQASPSQICSRRSSSSNRPAFIAARSMA